MLSYTYVAVLICNSSAAVTPCNYEQSSSYIIFLAKMFNLTCDSILKYTAHVILTMLVILNIAYPNIAL